MPSKNARARHVPDFVAPQLARIVAEPPSGSDWVHEVKFDGYRIQMRVENGDAHLLTRRGLDWTARFPEIARDGSKLPDCLLDGEVVALDPEGVADFAALQDALSSGKTSGLIFFIFDVFYANGTDLRRESLKRRKQILESLLTPARATHLKFVSHFASEGEAVLNAACRMKLEGIVSKRIDAPYVSGRADSWTKAKCRGGQEVVIGGWRGSNTNLRSLLVGAYRDGKLNYMGRVGTGFDATLAEEVLEHLRPLKRKTSPFASGVLPRLPDVNWVEPKVVAEVGFGTITTAGLLRQASFKGLREDKPARTVVPEAQPAAEPKSKKTQMPKTTKTSGKNPEIAGVILSHPDKELWPAAKPDPAFIKLDLAHHYEAFAERILLHVAGRPISMVRAPDGIDGPKFFQRHANKQGLKARGIKVKGEPEPYLAIDDLEGLVSLAQAAVLEIHPWGCKKDEPDVPERIIFDLDPAPDVSFDKVIAGAKDFRERLEWIGLTPFVKTTGGKGIHVTVAVKGSPKKPLAWPDAKEFARVLCVQMAADSPELYTTTVAKKARGGKIFLDYLRNDRTSTAVAPWSPRARPHAPVSTPLEWSQLKKGLDPLAFTLRTAAQLLKRPDPWKDLHKSAESLDAARKKLG